MTNIFFTEKRLDFMAHSVMDVFKLLLPVTLATGLFTRPIAGMIKIGILVGLAFLFWVSIRLLPGGAQHESR